jgi:hypothetical protein
MVLYIANQIGDTALYDMSLAVSNGESFAASYERIVGQPLAALLPNFNIWIFSQAAVNDFNLDIYIDATRQPTETLSPTPFPPTRTATPPASLTPTAVVTPTVTGFHSATPLPTLTATKTPRLLEASNTPRPAGYKTPTPVGWVVPSDDSGPQIPREIALVIVAIMGIGGGIIIANGVIHTVKERRREKWL